MIRNKTDKDDITDLFELGKSEHPLGYNGVEVEYLRDMNTLVAEEEGELVGMISAFPVEGKTLLGMLVVDGEHRNQTLAPELIRAAVSKYGKAMTFTVPHAQKSFELAGFRITGYVMETNDDDS